MNEGRIISFREAIKEALEEELFANPRLIILGEDVYDGGVPTVAITAELEKRFPGRIINRIPLIEEMLCGIGLGMSVGGLKPVIQFDHGTFITLAFHELYRLGIWRYRMTEKEGPGVVIRIGHSGFLASGEEFCASRIAPLLHIPNLWIAVPSSPYYAKGLLKTALRANRPVVFIEHKHPTVYYQEGTVPRQEYSTPFGVSVRMKIGKDITIIAWMLAAEMAATASKELLRKEKIEAEVISLQTLNPLDMPAILESARKTKRVLVVEEEMRRGGIGAEICALLASRLPECRVERLAARNVPLPTSSALQTCVLPTIEDIMNACKKLLGESG